MYHEGEGWGVEDPSQDYAALPSPSLQWDKRVDKQTSCVKQNQKFDQDEKLEILQNL